MQRIGIFPGSFDPFTKGHESVVNRFLPMFDLIIVAIGVNTTKQYLFSLESRVKHIESLFSNNSKIVVLSYSGLTTDLCKENKYCLVVLTPIAIIIRSNIGKKRFTTDS